MTTPDMPSDNGEKPPMSWERVAHLARHLDSPSAPPPMRQTARDLAVTARSLYAENARLQAALSARPMSDGPEFVVIGNTVGGVSVGHVPCAEWSDSVEEMGDFGPLLAWVRGHDCGKPGPS